MRLPPAPSRIPWPALGAALLALGTFGTVAGFKPLLIAFFLAIGGSYFSAFRLGDSMVRWWVRIGLLLMAVLLHINDPQEDGGMIGATRGRNVLAMAAAAEVVFQFWRHRPRDPHWGPLAVLFFSGAVLTAATNTTGDASLQLATPLYFLCCVGTILGLRPRRTPGRSAWRRGTILLVAVALAASVSVGVSRRRSELMDIGFSLLMGRWPDFQERGTGDSPQLGPLFGQRGSPARTLRIEGYDGGHLRGAAFFDYARGGWQPALSARRFVPAGSNTLALPTPRKGRTNEATVTRLSSGNSLIYLPSPTVSLDAGDAESPEYAREADGPVRASEKPPYVYRFQFVEGLAGETFQGILATKPAAALRNRCLAVPKEIAPEIARLARAMAGGARTDAEKIAAVVSRLQAEHQYSLRYKMPRPQVDPVVDFLANKKDAHCEFFASGAALLLRSLGVPTRYVTGFYAHEEEGPGQLVVRQRDAHAWVEAWVGGVGWVTVEATPPSGLPDEKADSVEGWRRVYEWLQDAFLRLKEWLADLPPEQLALLGTAFLVLLASAGMARWWRDRRRARTFLPGGLALPPPALRELAVRFEKALIRAGAPASPARPWSESVAGLPGEGIRERAEAFVSLYDAVRFGNETSREPLEETLNRLERALAEEKSKKSG